MRTVIRHLKTKTNPLLTAAMDVLFPPRCPACKAVVESADQLCASCFCSLRFITEPQCSCCGLPFEFDVSDDALCGACMQHPPAYDQARAAFVYDDFSRRMITLFKYADHTQHARGYAHLLARAGATLIAQSDVMIPVPLHTRRLLQRGFNQSAVLAYELSDLCHLPVWPDGMQRIIHTKPQASLSRSERIENVKGAFRIHHEYADALIGKRVLLIDDVMTSGATIEACTKMLLGAQAKAVYVLTLARTIRES